MNRVLRKNGIVVVLEFSKPRAFPFRQLYSFYFKFILPVIGKWVSRDRSAYTYLPESVNAFPDGKTFLHEMENAGFTNCYLNSLTFGIATIYCGEKI
jgi:demethylmenaquinone methyltransferase / 2-methoxy-6-polyprenyl-1,4-benzoquinol methylase